MDNQGRNVSYDSAEMGDEGFGRNANSRAAAAAEITGQPQLQLFKDDFTNQGSNKENSGNWPDFTTTAQGGTNYHQQGIDDNVNQGTNQGYKLSGNAGYTNQSGNEGYKNSGNDDQGYNNSGQDSGFLQQTGGGVINIAQGAASMAKGAAAVAANMAQGASTAVNNTLGMSTDSTTASGTTNNPNFPHTRV